MRELHVLLMLVIYGLEFILWAVRLPLAATIMVLSYWAYYCDGQSRVAQTKPSPSIEKEQRSENPV